MTAQLAQTGTLLEDGVGLGLVAAKGFLGQKHLAVFLPEKLADAAEAAAAGVAGGHLGGRVEHRTV